MLREKHTLEKVMVEPFGSFAFYHCLKCNAYGPFSALIQQQCPAKTKEE